MDKRRGGSTALSPLLCAGALVCLLAHSSSGAAADPTWHPNPARHHAGLPPLSAPPPTAGADLPHFGFPLQPTLGSAAPPTAGGEGYPFIGSNPTVPLPTGMTDTATVLPLPDTATKVVGMAAAPAPTLVSMIGLVPFFLAAT